MLDIVVVEVLGSGEARVGQEDERRHRRQRAEELKLHLIFSLRSYVLFFKVA